MHFMNYKKKYVKMKKNVKDKLKFYLKLKNEIIYLFEYCKQLNT